jgi:hypothetical protein
MTTQISDVLIYNKEINYIKDTPLQSYLDNIELPYNLVPPDSTLWRGYTAKWAIDNKKLFLIEWQGYILDFQKVNINYLFPGEDFVFANWFSGQIKVPLGDLICYPDGGYESVFEGEMFLIFENGVLKNEYSKWLSREEIEDLLSNENNLPF